MTMLLSDALLVAQSQASGGLRVLGILLIIALVLVIILLFRKLLKG